MSLPLHSPFRWANPACPRAARWVETAARAGYVTSGVIYFIFSGLALSALETPAPVPEGARQAIFEIGKQPFGTGLLALTAAGLGGFALWRAIQAIFDPERRTGGFQGVFRRIGEGVGAIAYASLCLLAVQTLRGQSATHTSHKTWVAWLLSQPFGVPLVATLGAITIIVGGVQIYRAVSLKFGELLRWHQMRPGERKLAVWSARAGLCSRALILFAIGYFVLRSALTHDASRTKDVGEALAEIATRPFGSALYVAISIGFAAFGVYQLVLSRYRRIEPQL